MNTRTRQKDDPATSTASCDHLYLVLDSGALGMGARFPLDGIVEVSIGRSSADQLHSDVSAGRLRIACPDAWMSTEHAVLTRPSAQWVVTDQGSRNGVMVNGLRQERALALNGDVIELGGSFFVIRQGEIASATEHLCQTRERSFSDTLDPALASHFDELGKIAVSSAPVLITGATGTGKERSARAVHDLSGRSGSFIAVNCGALPAGLVESELFGHSKGAFSGATTNKSGLVVAASGGTLFLDEIADLPLAAQAALLRVLEQREVRPLGADSTQPVDLRIVAATHQDLPALVTSGDFREDLYARLMGFELRLPTLQARSVDIGIMLGELLPPSSTLSASAARAILRYHWPMNIRELAQVAGRAHALAVSEPITLSHLPQHLQAPSPKSQVADGEEAARKAELVALLETHKGNVTRVATAMNKGRTQIQRWLKRFDIDANRYR